MWQRPLDQNVCPTFGPRNEITCVDRDPKWFEANPKWTDELVAQDMHVTGQAGDATSPPFADCTFDFVTCQTVLIHIESPLLALKEMLRVLAPSGLLLCVEPDNFATSYSESSLSRTESLDGDVAAFRFAMAQQRGRIKRGLGNLSLGGRLPGMFASIGVADIRTFLSDKAVPLIPPYDVAEQASTIRDIEHWYDCAADFSRDEVRVNFIAGGGNEAEFEANWAREVASRNGLLEAIRTNKYDHAGGFLMYLISGIKKSGYRASS